MSRIISYDHGPVKSPATRKAIQLPAATLDRYAGKYTSSQVGNLVILREGDHLVLQAGEEKMVIYPESETKFFYRERDLVFEFVKGNDGKVLKIIIIEQGQIVDEATPAK